MRIPTLLLSCLLLAAASGSRAADAQDVIERYIGAINGGNVDSALDTFTDDASLVAGPDCTAQEPCTGKAQIRKRFLEPMIAQHLRLRSTAFEGGPGLMRVGLKLQLDEFKQNGFDVLKGTDEVRLRDGRIASVLFQFDTSDPPTAEFLKIMASRPPVSRQ